MAWCDSFPGIAPVHKSASRQCRPDQLIFDRSVLFLLQPERDGPEFKEAREDLNKPTFPVAMNTCRFSGPPNVAFEPDAFGSLILGRLKTTKLRLHRVTHQRFRLRIDSEGGSALVCQGQEPNTGEGRQRIMARCIWDHRMLSLNQKVHAVKCT